MKFKKITAVILAATITFGSLTTFGLAEENLTADDSEQVQAHTAGSTFIEGDLQFKELEDGTLSVSCADESRETITEAIIPNEVNGKMVTKMENFAFEDCKKLTSIIIPQNVTNGIKSDCFGGCINLAEIKIDSENIVYSSEDGVVFNKDKSNLIYYPQGKTNKYYTIPESVTNIGWSAMVYSENLMSVKIPNSVAEIVSESMWGMTGLKTLIIPDNVTTLMPGSFTGCINLAWVFIPESVATLSGSAFAASVSTAGTSFSDNFTDIYYGGNKEDWNKISGANSYDNIVTIHYNCVPIDITDKTTKINATGIFSTQVDFSVKPIEELSNDTQYAYDLTFTDASGVEIQPETEVTVKIPVPETFKDKELYVYHVLDGKNIPVDTVFENGMAIFTADHFSTFIISEKQLSETEEQPSEPEIVTPGDTDTANSGGSESGSDQKSTGIALAIAPVVLAAGMAVVALSKKKK